jgi:phytoene dehydrogenase-like protein
VLGPTPRGRYDAIIVGAGHNGLAAAAYLARSGRSCAVLERLDHAGGAAVSGHPFPGVDVRLSRYSYLVSLLPQQIVEELGLDVRLLRRRISSYTPDPRTSGATGLLVDASDPAGTAASFQGITGDAGAHSAWERLHDALAHVARVVFPTLTEPLRTRAELRALVGEEHAWELLFERPISEGIAAAIGDDLVRGVLETDALIGTFASTRGRDLRQNRCFLYHVIGRGTGDWLLPLGGMGSVSGELERAALAAGAELHTGTEVSGIEPGDDGVLVRAATPGGEVLLAAGHVLVGAAPAVLARLLGRRSPAEQVAGSQLKVNLLLTRLPRLRDSSLDPREAFSGTVHFNETSSQLQSAYEQARRGELPELVPCEAYCHSLTDPSILGAELAAAGVQTMTVFALHMPAALFGARPGATRDQALAATLRSLDSLLAEPIDGLVLRAPDGRPCIEAHTPADLERELCMPGGHIFHADLSWPFAESEQEVGRWGVETEHPRLMLCGAGARRGGGVSAIPGRNAAMAVLECPG